MAAASCVPEGEACHTTKKPDIIGRYFDFRLYEKR
jgi:hypothetical protein